MTNEEQVALAKAVFNDSEQKVLGVDDSCAPTIVVSVEDEYGVLECEIRYGDLYDAPELRRSLEAFKHGRATKIGEWRYQKKLSAEIIDHLNGDSDPTDRMRWLPNLVYERFLDDFRLRFPELEKLAKAGNFDKDAVIAELQSIPFSWQKSR